MGYIYIFTNSDHKNYSLIGYADNWKNELDALNKNSFNLAEFDWNSYLKVDDKSVYEDFVLYIQSLHKDARKIKSSGKKTNYFEIRPNDMRKDLKYFADTRDISITEHTNDRNSNKPTTDKEKKSDSSGPRLSKGPVVEYLRHLNYKINKKNCTFASKNSRYQYYWANPHFDCLDTDWTLILNDSTLKKFYLLEIKGGTIEHSELKSRTDRRDEIQLTIAYGDPKLTDIKTHYEFIKFKFAEVDYQSDEHVFKCLKDNSGKPEGVKTKTDKNNQQSLNFALSEIFDATKGDPYRIDLPGGKINVKSWRDALRATLEYLYNQNPSVISSLANNNATPKEKGSVPYITKNRYLIKESRLMEELFNTGIYYLLNSNANDTICFIKFLLTECNIDPKDCIVWFKQDK